MIKIAVIVWILAVFATANHSHRTYLSPIIPPTAFVGQYYTCQFRVLGMDFPQYEFHGLPPNMTGNHQGRVIGTPGQIGSYPITVSYRSSYYQSQTKLVFMVVEKTWPEFDISKQVKLNKHTPLVVYLEQNKTIHMFADDITIKVNAVGGKPPYVWTYLRMPEELEGDKNGIIRGFFDMWGSYSFGVNCADGQGHSADVFITINIQPMTFFGAYTIKPVYVKNMNPPIEYDWGILTQIQKQMSENYFYLYGEATKEKQRYEDIMNQFDDFEDGINIAKKKVEYAVNTVNLTMSIQAKALLLKNKKQASLRVAEDAHHSALQRFENARKQTEELRENYRSSQKAKNISFQKMRNATKKMTEAEAESAKAEQQYSKKKLQVQGIELDVNLALDRVIQAKSKYENVTAEIGIHDSNVKMRQSQLTVAKVTNGMSEITFNETKEAAIEANNRLQFANLKVAKIRREQNKQKEVLEQAQFQLQKMKNQLKVAQAAKKEADRLLLIAKMYGEQKLPIPFQGCSQPTYPSMAGSAIVAKVFKNELYLNSGQRILWGDCTKRAECQEGDLVYFSGYLKNGGIHADTIEKLQQP